jgi:MoaA/NifB/PqqE/SkfB family radical SAM enzyme
MKPLTVLWRGPLSGCNYDCAYCPFAKRKDDRATLAKDAAALLRFTQWATAWPGPLSIFFTPWGEALIRKSYREAMIALSHREHIETVAIQTNLSCSIDWIGRADLSKLALWATYHPGETPRAAFLEKIHALEDAGARYSVGIVALREHFEAIEALRRDLPSTAYLWINAESRIRGQYTQAEVERLVAIDPYFELNNRTYASKGQACGAGETAISVDGEGRAKRCHFTDEGIGNIYHADFASRLFPRACPAELCKCHIGYVHLESLDLAPLFPGGVIERRALSPSREAAHLRLAAFDAAQVSRAGL